MYARQTVPYVGLGKSNLNEGVYYGEPSVEIGGRTYLGSRDHRQF